ITMVAKSSANPVFQSARIGAEDAAKNLSEKYSMIDVRIDWRTPAEEDASEQAERIRNAVEDGSEAILVSCSDDSLLTAAINDAVDRGVPVMTFDSDAPASKRFAFYGPDDIAIGETIMNELAALVGEQGQIAVLGGNQSAPNLQKRVEGVQQTAARYPGIEIVGVFYHPETAADAAAEVLRVNSEFPQLKGWAMVGGWPFFSNTLMNRDDLRRMKIVVVDALPRQLPYIEEGIVDVLLGQPTFRWGEVCVEKVIDKIHLNKEVPEINPMGLIRVSKDNLGGWSRQLRAWGYTNIPREYLKM
ncbi:MAG: substrate-binding domain-containing protein, partial [Calditrichia bacterium]